MPIVQDRIARSAFPFFGARCEPGAMNGAHLTLRFGTTRLRTDVYWPRTTTGRLTLALTDEVSPADPVVGGGLVVAVQGRYRCAELLGAMCWLAEHAGDLDATSDRLIVAGGAAAARLAVAARDVRWPELHRQVLVYPRFTADRPMPSAVSDVAPATIVHGGNSQDDGRRYAAMLRDAGVTVEELRR
jgi:hypothetical protein